MQVVTKGNDQWFQINNVDTLSPFFMSILSESNHWLFIASNGGISAGRKNEDNALFPYYTHDKIIDSNENTGSKSIIRIFRNDKVNLWEPFSYRSKDQYKIKRVLYKNRQGNKIIFEESNIDLELKFSIQWNTGDRFGFIKKASLENFGRNNYDIQILDGIQNIVPAGVTSVQQNQLSNLVDAYKKNELVKSSGLGIYTLSAIISDKAEPAESLNANVAWAQGLHNPKYLISTSQLDSFRKDGIVNDEFEFNGAKGAFFAVTNTAIKSDGLIEWQIIADVNLDHKKLVALNEKIKKTSNIYVELEADIDEGTRALTKLVNSADGFQNSSNPIKDSKHYSNVLNNILRGGVFHANYDISIKDFSEYIKASNKDLFDQHKTNFLSLHKTLSRDGLINEIKKTKNLDFMRLAKEYLPLKFSRRHGDPSRPWNKFSIITRDELDGSQLLYYEGNWRDIFQNWEALLFSFPNFADGMITRFLNASTFDGYNPYRLTKFGFDWETIEPDNPWSYVGYWGDHQIIYLLKIMEFLSSTNQDKFKELIESDLFVYANVPYKIKSYQDIVNDPKDTIEYDYELDALIRSNRSLHGSDSALLLNAKDNIHYVSFFEKILANILSKISNFIPGAGIWMNTQRPEWNDANNALVGNGASIVTLCYLRRFLLFIKKCDYFQSQDKISISKELLNFFNSIKSILNGQEKSQLLDFDDKKRRHIADQLGEASTIYRNWIYSNGFSGQKSEISFSKITDFIDQFLEWIDHTLESNKRDDTLFHSYNLIDFSQDSISIHRLDEMLEGQVAIISSDYLSADQSVKLLKNLFKGRLFREDQSSFILYPTKQLPKFLEKNTIAKSLFNRSSLLKQMIEDNFLHIVSQNSLGEFHFNSTIINSRKLRDALIKLGKTKYSNLAQVEQELIMNIYEATFNHKSFTGRSGTFYAYEGIGSIYWHMVSKLQLAVMEKCFHEKKNLGNDASLKELREFFFRIDKGASIHKTPEIYGAFPTDPYSHTPLNNGAQQPGMTGQVKEDILIRYGELGIIFENDKLCFDPFMLKMSEFSTEERSVEIIRPHNNLKLLLPKLSLLFTLCEVPIIYRIDTTVKTQLFLTNGQKIIFDKLSLDPNCTELILKRTGKIEKILINITEKELRI